MKGKIVLIPFPFTDLTATKLRPALVLYEGEKDVVAAFISSRTEKPKATDIIIDEKHPEFKRTGLKLTSAIKLDKVATISKSLIVGEIGEVGTKTKKAINHKIAELYILT
ncbi:type II toxin-antitoxin system PemK/MazF family toxin [Candidatus Bathyarchaeota archaeon A05DMB-2]|nr:type II toxin-antitoxin system PemK/MazF family toxin [Candidatus Bathyarchaeota archaeon A05DMB-2]